MDVKVFVVAAAGLLMTLSPAQAWFDTAQLEAVCRDGLANRSIDNPKFAMCTGLVLGTISADFLERKKICIPATLSTKDALEQFVNFARKEPNKDTEGTTTLYRSMVAAFPCPN